MGHEEYDGDKKNGVKWRDDKRNREEVVEGRKVGRVGGPGGGMRRKHEEWSKACRKQDDKGCEKWGPADNEKDDLEDHEKQEGGRVKLEIE